MATLIIEEDGVLIQSLTLEELDGACDFLLSHLDEIIAAEEAAGALDSDVWACRRAPEVAPRQ